LEGCREWCWIHLLYLGDGLENHQMTYRCSKRSPGYILCRANHTIGRMLDLGDHLAVGRLATNWYHQCENEMSWQASWMTFSKP
jgi:hypothetical protein